MSNENSQKLTNTNNSKITPERLDKREIQPFRIAICEPLDNHYEFKDMTPDVIKKDFQNFLAETVYKELTISDVDDLFLRKKGMKNKNTYYHYGKDRKPFRIFGYYNDDGYFVLCRIDPQHKTHKSK